MKSENHKMCDYCDKIEYLSQAVHIDDKIRMLSDTIINLHAECESVRVKTYDIPKVRTSLKCDSLENSIIRMCEKQQELQQELEQLVALKCQIRQAIDDVRDGEARQCLRWIYLEGKTTKEYAEFLCYSPKTATRRKLDALSKFRIPENRILIK